jgi:hypothetical protein
MSTIAPPRPYAVEELLTAYPQGAKPPEPAVDLADRAFKLLGYRSAKAHLRRTYGQTMDELTLLDLLREHAFKAFRPADVERYQQAMIDEALAPIKRRVNRLLLAFQLVFVASSIFSLWAVGAYSYPGDQAIISQTNAFGPLLMLWMALIIIGVLYLWAKSVSQRTTAEWTHHALSDYTSAIPSKALELAVTLKEHTPSCSFSVLEFSVEREPLDPFLCIHFGDASLALKVWEEPKFDGVLQV